MADSIDYHRTRTAQALSSRTSAYDFAQQLVSLVVALIISLNWSFLGSFLIFKRRQQQQQQTLRSHRHVLLKILSLMNRQK